MPKYQDRVSKAYKKKRQQKALERQKLFNMNKAFGGAQRRLLEMYGPSTAWLASKKDDDNA